MKIQKGIVVEGNPYTVTISDDKQALLAAHAAGGAIIGVVNPAVADQSLSPALFAVEDWEDVDEGLLERAVRRRFRLPFAILWTPRLKVREYGDQDPLDPETADGDGAGIFVDYEKRKAYIESQYGFYGYGLWALEERESGLIVGKAGIDAGELSYHIFGPYRKRGYAREACRAILHYARESLDFKVMGLRVWESNTASLNLAESLGFRRTGLEKTADGRQIILMERVLKV